MWRLLTHKSYHIIHIHSCEFSHCKVPVLWLGTRQTWACIRGNPRFWVLFCFSQSVISLNVWGVGKCLDGWQCSTFWVRRSLCYCLPPPFSPLPLPKGKCKEHSFLHQTLAGEVLNLKALGISWFMQPQQREEHWV